MKPLFPILLTLSFLLTGCIVLPVPHVTRKSPRIQGRILDAETGQPLNNAVVQFDTLDDSPGKWRAGASAATGPDGNFQLEPGYNFHFAVYANLSWARHFPGGTYWYRTLTVSRDGYRQLRYEYPKAWKDTNLVFVGNLKLQKNESASTNFNQQTQATK